jgi:predicted signal transduction protein with EAL and GGDEF domain
MLQSPNQAASFAERIIEIVSEPLEVDGHLIVVGTSVGIAIAPADGEEAEVLLRNADIALYRAKFDGRGAYRFFEAGMDEALRERRKLELDLRRALERNEFFLVYQPLVDAQTEELRGVEALLRWKHPTRGVLSPNEFISLAEETGLIVGIGEWVLKKACKDAVTWPSDIRLAVNLSPVQFKSFKVAAAVVAALDRSGLVPSRLELEVTESVLLSEDEATLAILHQLHGLGVRIVLDDFGTGYSSLSYLRSFPFDKIKIDRSFVQAMTGTDESSAIVRAIAGLGSNLGIVTTAEGVENFQQLEQIREHGCIEAQGYYFSEPVSKETMDRIILKRSVAA